MSKTILLADDSVTIQKVVELTFMDQDYQIVAVSDGASALDKMSQQRPDLVIADVHMPGADGYEVCRRTKQDQPGIPVLLLVGTFEQFDADKATAAGADGHLKKPFDSQELLSQVETLIARSAQTGAPEAAADRPAAAAEPAAPEPTAAEPPADESPPEAFADPFSLDDDDTEIEELEPPALLDEDTEGETAPAEAPTAAAEPMPVFDSEPEESAETEPAAEADAKPAIDPAAEPSPAPPVAARAHDDNGSRPLEDEDLERIARRVVELLGERLVRDVAWEVIPDLAEVIIRERIRELESQVE